MRVGFGSSLPRLSGTRPPCLHLGRTGVDIVLTMLARFAILMLAAGMFLQPLLAVVHGASECCAVESSKPSTLAALDGGHECHCCETAVAADEGRPADRERNDQRSHGCDCPKSCCFGVVKLPLGVSPAGVAPAWRDVASRVVDDMPGPAGDAAISRLKRPPRAFATV